MVKCADCGFLAQRHIETRELRDAEEALRKSGKNLYHLSHDRKSKVYIYEVPPLCTKRQTEFPTEEQPIFEAVQQERQCSVFMRWLPGFTPKEHQEMLDRQYLMEREDRRDEEMRGREDRRDELAEARYQEQMKEQRAEHKRELLVLGLLMIAAVLTAAVINAGWIPKPPWAGDTASQPLIVVVTAIPQQTPTITPIPPSTPSIAGSQLQ